MAFSRATEDLEPNGEREDNVEREENIERDGKGDLDVEGARPEEDVLAGMGMCEVIVDGGKSLPSRHTSLALTRSPCPHSSESSQQHLQRLLQYKTLQTPSVYTTLSSMVLAQLQQK